MVDLSIVFCMFTRPGNSGLIWQFPLGARLPGVEVWWIRGVFVEESCRWTHRYLHGGIEPRAATWSLEGWGWMIADGRKIAWNTHKKQQKKTVFPSVQVVFWWFPSMFCPAVMWWWGRAVGRARCGTLWHVVLLFTDGSRHVEPTLYIGHVCDLYTTLHLNKREREKKKERPRHREREGEIYRVYQIVLRL